MGACCTIGNTLQSCHNGCMKATLVLTERVKLSDTSFAEIVIWQVPKPVLGCAHGFKYRLAYVSNKVCVLRYDNEAGKGDHRHLDECEAPYVFTTLNQLVDDFWADIARLRG